MLFQIRLKLQHSRLVLATILAMVLVLVPLHLNVDNEGWISIKINHAHATSGSGKNGSEEEESNENSHNDNDDDSHFHIENVRFTSNGVEICYVEGTCEEIKNGFYTLKSLTGDVLESRLATGADVARLRVRIQGGSEQNFYQSHMDENTRINEVKISGNDIRIEFSNGWREEIKNGRYELRDQFNRRVIRRSATDADLQRMRELMGS